MIKIYYIENNRISRNCTERFIKSNDLLLAKNVVYHKASKRFDIQRFLFLRLVHNIIIGTNINVRLNDVFFITSILDIVSLGSTSESASSNVVSNLHQLFWFNLSVSQQVSLAAGSLGE